MSDIDQSEQIVMSLPESGDEIRSWTEYSYNSNFLVPADGWTFTVAAEKIPRDLRSQLKPAARVTLSVNGHTQGDGYIDRITSQNDRFGGTSIHIEGRDRLAQMVDSQVDPRTKFAAGQTLNQFIEAVAEPFGWGGKSGGLLTDSNEGNRNVLTGQHRGNKATKKGKSIKSIALHSLKPYPAEGAFAFLARITQRFGLWVWLSAEGNTLIVGRPEAIQESRYLLRRQGDESNILDGSVTLDMSDQPTVIVADGYSGGGEFGKSRIKALIVNPIVYADGDAKIIGEHVDARKIQTDLAIVPVKVPVSRPLYLHDDESKTPEQLEAFVRREMSLRTRKGLEAHYTASGHINSGQPWAVDTIVDVQDDLCDLHEPMYVLGRTFTKSRWGGTRTELHLIRPGTLEF